MAQSVKLADDVMAQVLRESARQGRSVPEQIAHWIKIARAIEESPSFDYARVTAALEAKLSPDELSPEEQEVWFARFVAATAEPTEQERAFYAKRKRLGLGVGMNDSGELVYQSDQSE